MKIKYGIPVQLTNKDKEDITDFFDELSKTYPKRIDDTVTLAIYNKPTKASFYLTSESLIKIYSGGNLISFDLYESMAKLDLDVVKSMILWQVGYEIDFIHSSGFIFNIVSKEIYDSFKTYFKDSIVK
jgi:hypothetical protein